MKRIAAIVIAAALAYFPVLGASADYAAETDYMAVMIEAVRTGQTAVGTAAQNSRDEKIADLQLDYVPVSYEELDLLSRIIYAEAGSVWLSGDWKMAVGEVVLNRVASPEFPDTVREVVEQPGQYYGKNSSYFNSLRPDEASILAAKKLLEGERVMGEPTVVFQSNYRLGSGVFLELKDRYLGSTYLCYSNHPELYAG